MRILFHHRIASRDGQSVHVEELMAALRRAGHDVMLVGPPGLSAIGFGGSSALVDRIKRHVPPAAYELLEVVYNIKAFLRLWAAVRSWRPDVVYERFSLFLFAGLWVRRLSGVPILLEVNSPLFEERAGNDGLRLHRLGRRAQRWLWNGVDHVLPVTNVLARIVAGYGVPEERVTVIPNGVDPARFSHLADITSARAALGAPPRLILGFTGFIRGWNAVHLLVDLVSRHRGELDLHVLVVGDGPARDSLQEHARRRGVADRLSITGVVERDDVARHVALFDIAVLPGVTAYSSPLKLFEYLQVGCAIVAPDSDNIREILTDGENALLFDPVSEGALEAAVLRLCGDAALRGALAARARRTITARSLTWDHNAERVAGIAGLLVQARRRGHG